jgi:cyclohexadienyl dehydratase
MVTFTIPLALNNPLIGGICPQVHAIAHVGREIEWRKGAARILVCFAFVLAFAFLVPLAQAEPPTRLEAIVKRGTLRVGMTGDYAPFSAFDPATSTFRGFDVDMADSLGKALGVRVEYVRTAWPQLTRDFEADRFDIAMGGISITPERESKGDFSAPIMQEGKTPIARCKDTGKFESLADIDKPGTRVIVNPGGTNERFTRANIKNAEVTVYVDNVTIFDEIAKGNADLMITDASETRYQQKLHPGVLCAVHPDQPFDHAQKAYWLQRDAALKAFVDNWIKQARDDGRFSKTYSTWFE